MPPTETLTDTPPPPPPPPTETETATATATLTPTATDLPTATATLSETPTFTALPTLSTLPETLTPTLSPFPEATAELTAEATAQVTEELLIETLFVPDGTAGSLQSTSEQNLLFYQDFDDTPLLPGQARGSIGSYSGSPTSGISNRTGSPGDEVWGALSGAAAPVSVQLEILLGDDPDLTYRVYDVTWNPTMIRSGTSSPTTHEFWFELQAADGTTLYTEPAVTYFPSGGTLPLPPRQIPQPGIDGVRRVVFYHRTTGGVAGSLYVLAIDQVAIATNQVSSVDCTPPGGTQGAGTLSDPQAPLCTTEQLLGQYNVVLDDPENWTPDEQLILLTGVENVALAWQVWSDEAYSSAQEAFKAIMLFETTNTIAFQRRDGNTCATNPLNPEESDGKIASIACGDDINLTEYTAVHELGHVFSHRTGSDFRALLGSPAPLVANRQIVDNVDVFVFGVRGKFFASNSIPSNVRPDALIAAPSPQDPGRVRVADWQRGARGWGTSAAAPGPCDGSSAPTPPNDFQQNPCLVTDYVQGITQTQTVTEQEEAAADSFLNWVYRVITQESDADPDWSGFWNTDWEDQNCTTIDCDLGLPGDARFIWMNCAIEALSNKYGFLPDNSVLENPLCEPYDLNP